MRPVLIASISGILYALIAELPLLPLSPPAPPSRMQDIVGYYVQYGDVLRMMQLFGGFGAMLLLVFLLGLATYLRRLQDRPSSLSAGVVTAGVAVVTMNLIANAASLSIVLNAGRVKNTAQIQLLHDFANATDILMSLPIAVVVAFASWILVRGQRADRWIGLTGFPVAALLAFRALAVGGGPTLPFPPLYPVWFEALAISMAVRELRGGDTCVHLSTPLAADSEPSAGEWSERSGRCDE